MKKRKFLFIVNPVAGTGKQKNIVSLLGQHIDTRETDYEIVFSQRPSHASELSRDAVNKKYDAVVAVGGDGSVHETGSVLTGTETALGIIPAGSGNGFANHFKIPHDISSALHIINRGKIIKTDTLSVNGACCLNCAGTGFDAHIAHLFARQKKRGFVSYFKITVKEFFRYTPKEYILCIDEKTISIKPLLITFANTSQYGNNIIIAPGADVQDGYMDVCIVKKISLFKIPGILFHLFGQSICKSSVFENIRCKAVTLKCTDDNRIHIDGEPKQTDGTLNVFVNPLSLNLIVP